MGYSNDGMFSVFERNDVLGWVSARSALLKSLLERVEKLPCCGDVRLLGLMGGIEIVKDRATKEPFATHLQMGGRVCRRARRYGVILRPLGDVVVLMPPLTIEENELELLVDAVVRSMEETT